MDRLVEPHLVEVDVGDVAAQRILLVVLEDRRVRVAVAVEDDVEDGVQSAGAGEHATKVALGNGDRLRVVAAPIEDARNQPLLTQAASVSGTPTLPLANFEPYS